MTKQHETQIGEITVEVYMAGEDPPPLHDFFVTRSGAFERAHAAVPVGGLIQIVLAGSHPPSPRQLLALKRNFGLDERFRVLNFCGMEVSAGR